MALSGSSRDGQHDHREEHMARWALGADNDESPTTIERRALALWPRLDAKALKRCGHDPRRIARLVARRTPLPLDTIMGMLRMPLVTPQDLETWFG
jgi:hypothetical protein